ncbi:MAG: T9SS type A sorting domain-containing protein [Saprospirales bacterium]|nr:T9SS type A sorting domain-containing protein [Saprospirales bacterium]
MKLMKNHKLNFSLAAAMLWGMFVMMSSAQVFGQGFEYNYGGNGEDQGQAILQTDDRGYLIAGYSESFGSDNDLDVYLIRTDVDGQKIWEKVIDEGFIEHAYGMDATLDGGYIIVGDIRLTALDSFNVYLFKVNLRGDLLWSSQFGGTGFEQGFDVKATSDGGYLIAGRRLNQPNGDLDIYVIKADSNGDLVWEKTFGGSGDEEGWGVEEVSDGYMVSGNAINPNTNSSDIYVMKLDFNGNMIWDYYFDYPDTFEQGFGFTLASDGSYVVAGHKGFVDIFVAKLSEDGTTELWNKTFSEGVGGQANDVVETNDGNFVVGGIVETSAANIDLFIAKVDATNGAEIWTHTIGRTTIIDWAESLVERQDGGFALVGWNGQAALIFINDVKLIKADSDGRVRTNYLTGKVYADWNNDLTQDPGEQGIKNWVVEASGDNGSWFGTSDKDGFFTVLVDTGTYDVKVHVKGRNWESAYPVINNLAFPQTYDTIEVEFPIHSIYNCPTLFVDLSTDAVVSCENSTFHVTYRNEGTATASGVKVELEVDTDWTFSSASIPVFDQIGDSIYVFQVNDLEPGDEGNFEVTLNADCNAEIGTNFFVKAHITPDAICVPATGWDGSSIAVTGSCQGDTVVFELRNVSINPMTATLNYIVIEDEIMGKTEFQLPGNDVMLVKRYANGSTFRIVSEQSPNHPGNSAPTIAVEGCVAGGGTEFSKGMVTMFPEDEANSFIALDVQESIDPSAAIDLRAYPKGYRGDTIAANVDIEYHVRFQNTTDDTLFWVAVRDSLPLEHLNIATIQPGASSHPYTFQAYDNGVVKFVFDSIVLPPASENPDASKGFIQFKISQQPDLEPLTEIFNKALLYVGYDEVPVESVQKRHVIGGATLEDFVEIIVDAKEVPIPGVTVKVYPNPMDGQSTIVVEGMSFNQLDLKVYDAAGRLVRQEKSAGSQITLTKGNLKTGTYFFVLEADGQALKTGKVIVR